MPWDWQEEARGLWDTAAPHPAPERREIERLRARCSALEAECVRLKALSARVPWPEEEVVRALTRLISVCHPDKWGGESRVATALTQELLALRAKLQASGGGG